MRERVAINASFTLFRDRTLEEANVHALFSGRRERRLLCCTKGLSVYDKMAGEQRRAIVSSKAGGIKGRWRSE
jgi:hypothetical protein